MILFLLAASAFAQDAAPLAFDAASVKVNSQFAAGDRTTWQSSISATAGSLTMRNVNLTMMVAWAFDVQRPQVSGPEWINAQRYDVFGKADGPVKDEGMRRMLQTLLAERFKLAVHRESRQMETMVMLVPKGGHKMTESTVEGPTKNHQDAVRGTVIEGAALADLADTMSRELEMPVVDLTGLKGRFDFSFNPQRYVEALRARVMAERTPMSDGQARMIIMEEALAGDLGLRLEARKTALNVVVIDHAEKTPVEN